ncbi:MAG: imidazolonepropionase, partial [Burkholderiales bacterium]
MNPPRIDLLISNVRVVACTDDACAASPPGFVAISNGMIVGIGPSEQFDTRAQVLQELDGHGALLTPGLIDCHTHLVYAGNRAREFEMRLQGASYEEIARDGGGILSTVRNTRAAQPDELLAQSARRLQASMRNGVTTLEIKSGYGLSLADEIKSLQIARTLGKQFPIDVRTTLLAAHALPPEFAQRPDAWIDEI